MKEKILQLIPERLTFKPSHQDLLELLNITPPKGNLEQQQLISQIETVLPLFTPSVKEALASKTSQDISFIDIFSHGLAQQVFKSYHRLVHQQCSPLLNYFFSSPDTFALANLAFSDPNLGSWLGDSPQPDPGQILTSITRLRPTFNFKIISNLISHHNRHQLFEFLSPRELLHLTNQKTRFARCFTKDTLFDSPHLGKAAIDIDNFLQSHNLHSSLLPWSLRLSALEQLATSLDRHGVTDEAITQVLAENYQATINLFDTFPIEWFITDPQLQQLVNQDPPPTSPQDILPLYRNYILKRLRNGLSGQDLNLIRRHIRQYPEHYPTSTASLTSQERRAVEIQESPYYHLAHLIPLSGPEIELQLPKPKALSDFAHEILSCCGFKKGAKNPLELSPGPFQHPHTVTTLIRRYIDTGLFDPHLEPDLSLHFNLSVLSPALFAHLIWALRLDGHLFHPTTPSATSNNSYQLGIHPNSQDNFQTVYLESKDLLFVTPQSFNIGWRNAVWLGTAQKAYEKTLLAAHNLPEHRLLISKYDCNAQHYRNTPPPLISPRQINSAPASTPLQQLALVYHDFLLCAQHGVLEAGFPQLLQLQCPRTQARSAAQAIQRVFPTSFHHDYINPMTVDDPQTHITHPTQNLTFPNIVAYFRHVNQSHADRVSHILQQQDRAFLKLLHQATDYPTDRNLLTLFSSFPCGTSPDDLHHPLRLRAHFERVRHHYRV